MTSEAAEPATPAAPQAVPDPPPTMPGRGAFLLAIVAIAIAGFFGAVIGYGLTDLQTHGDSAVANVIGTVVGASIAVVGVGVVARLALRAYAEWHAHPPRG